jgi:AraC-like DNA-binding protein
MPVSPPSSRHRCTFLSPSIWKRWVPRSCPPALTPAQAAAAFGISTRYLHKLFETQHETVAYCIRDRRLDRCRLRLLAYGSLTRASQHWRSTPAAAI